MAADVNNTGRDDIIDLSKIDMPVKIEDRSFDKTMFPELIDYLKKVRDQSEDIILPGSKMEIKPAPGEQGWVLWFEAPIDPYNPAMGNAMRVYKPTNWAEGQTVSKTPMPRRYHDDLLKHGHIDLAADNLNRWLNNGGKYMVRTVGDQFRALVSDGFFAIDNYDLLAQIAKTVEAVNSTREEKQQPMMFHKVDISETNLYIDIIDEGREYDIGKGDKFHPMIVIKNSEVGSGAMSIEPGFFRFRCINRHIKNAILRKIHRGEKLSEGFYRADTRATARALWQKQVRDVMDAVAWDNNLFQDWADEMKEAKETKIDEDIPVVIHRVADEMHFSQDEESAILSAMMGDTTIETEDRGTAFSLIQGITAASKKASPDRKYEMDKAAGDTRKLLAIISRPSKARA